MSNRIKITRTAAMWLFQTARALFEDGSGMNIAGDDDLEFNRGLIDEIPMGTPEHYWANMLLHFARTVAGVMSHALAEAGDESDVIEAYVDELMNDNIGDI